MPFPFFGFVVSIDIASFITLNTFPIYGTPAPDVPQVNASSSLLLFSLRTGPK